MKDKSSKGYILITPVKNEEENLPNLIRSITNQTIKPVLWVIVDDGSSDCTPEIIEEAKEKYNLIQSIRLDKSVRDRGIHLANVIRRGFDFAYEHCEKKGLVFEFLGNIDADVVLEENYFENLLENFEKNPELGVASGAEWLINGDKKTYYKGRYPSGGDVLFRRRCYEECGGIPFSDLWDSVLNTKAKLRGWSVKRFDGSKALVMRDHCYADGLWAGYKKFGESSYIVDYNLFYAIAKGLKLSFKSPFYFGLAYLCGYISGLILRRQQINDKEIRYYYRKVRPREIKRYYINLLKKAFKR